MYSPSEKLKYKMYMIDKINSSKISWIISYIHLACTCAVDSGRGVHTHNDSSTVPSS